MTATIAEMNALGDATLRSGEQGPAVQQLATWMQKVPGYSVPSSDYFTSTVKDKILDFQKNFGLLTDGTVGKHTWNFFKRYAEAVDAPVTSNPVSISGGFLLKFGPNASANSNVTTYQNNLNKCGYTFATNDLPGVFFHSTLKATLMVQYVKWGASGSSIGKIDGVAGPETRLVVENTLKKSANSQLWGAPLIGYSCWDKRAGMSDKEALARMFYGESTESYDAMKMIAQVMVNRNKSPNYPNTAKDVIFQNDKQFTSMSTVNNQTASPDRSSVKWDNAYGTANTFDVNRSSPYSVTLNDTYGKCYNFRTAHNDEPERLTGRRAEGTGFYNWYVLGRNYFYWTTTK